MTGLHRHEWGAWSPAWQDATAGGWWRKRSCWLCGQREYVRVHAAEPETAVWHEGADPGDEQQPREAQR